MVQPSKMCGNQSAIIQLYLKFTEDQEISVYQKKIKARKRDEDRGFLGEEMLIFLTNFLSKFLKEKIGSISRLKSCKNHRYTNPQNPSWVFAQ